MPGDPETLEFFRRGLQGRSLEDLCGEGLRVVRPATSWGNCNAYVYQHPSGRRVFLKTFHRHPRLLRLLLLRRLLGREGRLMDVVARRVPGHSAAYLGSPVPEVMLQECLDGHERLRSRHDYGRDGYPPPELFRRIAAYVRDLHASGIAHGDIRKANVLVDARWDFRLIDWTTGCFLDGGASGGRDGCLRRSFFRLLCVVDDDAVQKLCHYYHPEEFPLVGRRPWYLRFGKWCRRWIYRRGIKKIGERFRRHG